VTTTDFRLLSVTAQCGREAAGNCCNSSRYETVPGPQQIPKAQGDGSVWVEWLLYENWAGLLDHTRAKKSINAKFLPTKSPVSLPGACRHHSSLRLGSLLPSSFLLRCPWGCREQGRADTNHRRFSRHASLHGFQQQDHILKQHQRTPSNNRWR